MEFKGAAAPSTAVGGKRRGDVNPNAENGPKGVKRCRCEAGAKTSGDDEYALAEARDLIQALWDISCVNVPKKERMSFMRKHLRTKGFCHVCRKSFVVGRCHCPSARQLAIDVIKYVGGFDTTQFDVETCSTVITLITNTVENENERAAASVAKWQAGMSAGKSKDNIGALVLRSVHEATALHHIQPPIFRCLLVTFAAQVGADLTYLSVNGNSLINQLLCENKDTLLKTLVDVGIRYDSMRPHSDPFISKFVGGCHNRAITRYAISITPDHIIQQVSFDVLSDLLSTADAYPYALQWMNTARDDGSGCPLFESHIVETLNDLEGSLQAISANQNGPFPCEMLEDAYGWCCEHHEVVEEHYSWSEETLRAFVAQWKDKRDHMLRRRANYLPTLYGALNRSGITVVVLQVLMAQYTSPCFNELVSASAGVAIPSIPASAATMSASCL